MNIFHSASLKLTAWYLSIIMVISIAFSFIVYGISDAELSRGFPPRDDVGRRLLLNPEAFETLREERVEEGRVRLLGNLFIVNVVTLTLGGGASYVLARRTLSPIKQAMDAQGRFISDASHELRTPLTAMQTEIEVALRDKKLDKAAAKHLLESNLEEVNNLRGLTDRLLQLSNGHDVVLGSVSLEEPAITALNRVLPLAQAKGIAIENNVPPILVRASSESLGDLLVILLENAIKYSPKGSRVVVDAKSQGQNAVLTVADTGVGIKAVDLPHVFDRFYRADLSRSKQHVEGHGLGLAIAKSIVETHKGSIEVESAPGQGTTITVIFPLAKSPTDKE